MPALLAPAGSFPALRAAINAGADCVYFGVGVLNMRSRAANFEESDLEAIVRICREAGVASCLTMNTIVYDDELPRVEALCHRAAEAGVSAVIASDWAVIHRARQAGLPVHISTQANLSNIDAVRHFAAVADVFVLARELSLERIANIHQAIVRESICGPSGELVRIELFAHGALCVALSGNCYMSLTQHGSSANRGACYQTCRRGYRVIDEMTGDELVLENGYVMSPKDLCTIEVLDQVVASGVGVLKIEGRGRSPEYVAKVTQCYRTALAWLREGTYSPERATELTTGLETVFNRGFWHGGHYLGDQTGMWSGIAGTRQTKSKSVLGVVTHFYAQPQVAEIKVTAGELHDGDSLLVHGDTSGVVEAMARDFRVNDAPSKLAAKGDTLTLRLGARVRPGDRVYLVQDR